MYNKRILVLGGTGAMGTPLVNHLAEIGYEVVVTTRTQRSSSNSHISYVTGNAHNKTFLKSLFDNDDNVWDAVVDFMVYTTDEFKERVELLLSKTKQYIFISSARVYAQSDVLITEDSPRLLETTTDMIYLNTDEYALSKARQEDILFDSSKRNWTIIRPSITYNDYRLQLGVLEKEHWLYRALHGRSIVFSKDIADKLTAMTTGYDVMKGITSIIGQEEALGEAFHITEPASYRWEQILEVYLEVLEEYLGKRPKVIMTEKSTCFQADWNIYQIIYCRYYNRTFDNNKIGKFTDVEKFTDARTGLGECLERFLQNPKYDNINWKLEAINDRVTGEWTPLSEICSKKMKIKYLIYRLNMGKVLQIYSKVKSMFTN